MTTTLDTYELSICIDCVQLDANGELEDGEGNDIAGEHAAKMSAQGWDGYVFGPDADCICHRDGYFSWSRCDGCGSTLGGTRFDYVAVAR